MIDSLAFYYAWFEILSCTCKSYKSYSLPGFKETKSATMNIFRFFYFLFKSVVKVELSCFHNKSVHYS